MLDDAVADRPHVATPTSHLHQQIPYYSVSGIQIRYLKVIERSGYQALPW